MARNLKAYRKNERSEKGEDQIRNEAQAGSAQLSGADMANIESMMNAYGGKSETELMDELRRMTERQKKDGSFDASAMQKTADSIMPMLTSEQRQKLIGIMNMLGN
ncbi:MAG: hypothetical protein IKI64_06205 [Clostridia bacterium]|nr:hypothetical protein [Clostridia bacterium]